MLASLMDEDCSNSLYDASGCPLGRCAGLEAEIRSFGIDVWL
jgi:hypothetical protein